LTNDKKEGEDYPSSPFLFKLVHLSGDAAGG
jgi:hypothetical protein